MRRTSLTGMLAGRLVGQVLVVVGCALALHWAYELVRPFFWLALLIGLPVVVVLAARRWSAWWSRFW